MSGLIDNYSGGSDAWDQFDRAIRAVVERSVGQEELYTTVIFDQLLYVATSIMLEREKREQDGLLEEWCDEMILGIDDIFNETNDFLDKLLADQDRAKKKGK